MTKCQFRHLVIAYYYEFRLKKPFLYCTHELVVLSGKFVSSGLLTSGHFYARTRVIPNTVRTIEQLTKNSVAILLSLGLVTGIAAGCYPAFSSASFNAIRALKGALSPSRRGGIALRSGLVVFHFFVSPSLIVGTLIAYRQLQYMQGQKLGYDKDQLQLQVSIECRIAPGMTVVMQGGHADDPGEMEMGIVGHLFHHPCYF